MARMMATCSDWNSVSGSAGAAFFLPRNRSSSRHLIFWYASCRCSGCP
jgi:hypothetical protein